MLQARFEAANLLHRRYVVVKRQFLVVNVKHIIDVVRRARSCIDLIDTAVVDQEHSVWTVLSSIVAAVVHFVVQFLVAGLTTA